MISRAQALAGGLSRQQVDRLVTARRWLPIYPGVYLAADRGLTEEGRVWAAALWAGDEATVSGLAAAWWHCLFDAATVHCGADRASVEREAACSRHPDPSPRTARRGSGARERPLGDRCSPDRAGGSGPTGRSRLRVGRSRAPAPGQPRGIAPGPESQPRRARLGGGSEVDRRGSGSDCFGRRALPAGGSTTGCAAMRSISPSRTTRWQLRWMAGPGTRMWSASGGIGNGRTPWCSLAGGFCASLGMT